MKKRRPCLPLTRFSLINKAAIDAYESAKKAYDALSAGEKNMAGEHTKAILDTMLKALTAYDITSGDGSTWKENNKDNGLDLQGQWLP